jgi:predicted dehydrogenase
MTEVLNIVVIGAGMYSVGRGTDGFGTILPAINEWKREKGLVGKVVFVSTNRNSSGIVLEKVSKLEDQTGIKLNIDVFPKDESTNYDAYKAIITSIDRPACAVIVVPDHLHYQVAKDCLEANLPVLMVKPLTPTVEEGKKLVKIADKKELYAVVEFHKRWDKANLMMKDTIQKNRIGDLLYCWVEYSQRKSIPTEIFKKWVEKTSILQYLGIHYIDVIRFATSAIPKRVMALGQKNWLPLHGLDAYDSIQCFIEWIAPNGSTFTQVILTNWIDPECSSSMSDQKIKIVGTKGRFESDQKNRGITINVDEHGIEQPNPDFCTEFGNENGKKEWKGYGIDSVKAFFSDVVSINSGVASLEELKAGRPTFSESLISTSVIEAAHESLSQRNIWIDIKL